MKTKEGDKKECDSNVNNAPFLIKFTLHCNMPS